MYMYVTSGQNYHNFNVSSMPKSTPCELSSESLSEHFLGAHNQIVTCRPRQSQSTPALLLELILMPNQGRCSMIRAYHGTDLAPGGRAG